MATVKRPPMQASSSLRLKRDDSEVDSAVASPRVRGKAVVLSKPPLQFNSNTPTPRSTTPPSGQHAARVVVTNSQPGTTHEPKIWTATGTATAVTATPPPPSPKRAVSIVRMNTVGTPPSPPATTTPLHAGRSPTIIRRPNEGNKTPLIAPRAATLVRRESDDKKSINGVPSVRSPTLIRKESDDKKNASATVSPVVRTRSATLVRRESGDKPNSAGGVNPISAPRSATLVRRESGDKNPASAAPVGAGRALVRRNSGEKKQVNVPSSPRSPRSPIGSVASGSPGRKEPMRKHIVSSQKSQGMVEVDVVSGRTAADEESSRIVEANAEKAHVINVSHRHSSARIVRVDSRKHASPTGSSASPFLHAILAQSSKSPFDKSVFGRMNPRELSFCLEDAYCPLPEILKAMTVKLNQDDVVVCSPLRTGQTPLLRGLTMLLSAGSGVPSDQTLLESVGFLGSTLSHVPVKTMTSPSGERRLFKTHINLRCFVRAEAPSKTSPKIIILLRDPLCVIESWFRHMFAVFNATTKNKNFPFGQADFRLFCPGTFSAARYQEGEDYAKFVSTAISVMHLPNVKLVFYEDLVTNPALVFRDLAEFVGGGVEYKDQVGKAIAVNAREQEFKLQPVFSDEFLFAREEMWKDHVTFARTTLRPNSYYELYESVTGRTYPGPKYMSSNAMAT